MSIFDFHASVLADYRQYVQSFLTISDDDIRDFVERKLLGEGVLWPDALLQLNPSYRTAETVDELAAAGYILPETAAIFRSENGDPIRLYQHQRDAILKGIQGQSYVVTSGTGSGKSLTYFVPIFDAILRGDPQERKVWAIVVYPMNALVNSQLESLRELAANYKRRTGREMPVRFAKYTGQESDEEKRAIQEGRPHVLLTNFVMLEMMLVRPQEAAFVDRTAANLRFLVLDELHTYRGRQGADVAMLVRRLRQRCGNPALQHIGTSATMIASPTATPRERRQAVADFAGKLFGLPLSEEQVIEETLVPVTTRSSEPSAEELRRALGEPIPRDAERFLASPLTFWLERAVGLEPDAEGKYRRKTPLSLQVLAELLASQTGIDQQACLDKLREVLLVGATIRTNGEAPALSFKLHQFISQGRTVYATYERPGSRYFTLDGQYYAPAANGEPRILFPLAFCRICGQPYYKVRYDRAAGRVAPWLEDIEEEDVEGDAGYLMMPPENFEWSLEYLPEECFDKNRRLSKTYRDRIPRPLYVRADGVALEEPAPGAILGYYQPKPFFICLACGEYYVGRQAEFSKLGGLSVEGRSSATTILGIAALEHATKAGIPENARKILSFTDNRQDASLQAGHFGDFVRVCLLRSAIYEALCRNGELRHFNVASETVKALNLDLKEIAQNPALDPTSPLAQSVWECFQDLIEYRIYEDLRRAWRIVHPNLEQCGLLRIEYDRLEEISGREELWRELRPLASCTPAERLEILRAVLDFFRKKLAISVPCLRETYQQQLRRRVNQLINDRWNFDESEQRLRQAARVILPGQPPRKLEGISLSKTSALGRYLRRQLPDLTDYDDFVSRLIALLVRQGLLREDQERGVRFVQLDAAVLVWRKGDGTPPPPDPVFSRRVVSEPYIRAQRRANEYFVELYTRRARSFKSVEGLAHTAQISYEERQERERRFREGDLSLLFCSPTMELGIDIRDLQVVHLRNVPPTPANYAQRSGRAGRKGDPALILTYCAAGSGHDQYFFRRREEMVAGAVQPPRIDLSNEDLARAHVHALWLSKVGLRIERSMEELVDRQNPALPLKTEVQGAIHLPETRLREAIEEARKVLQLCGDDLRSADWFTPEWIEKTLRDAPETFDRALDRWRQLFLAADHQLREAHRIQQTSFDPEEQRQAEQQAREALRQRNLLLNVDTAREESDFYPYRYLASEGFLPGYNFPRLPVRIFIPRGEGEFISRSRFLAITEFGPDNFVYHEGAKYQVKRFWAPPGGLSARRTAAKLCNRCGCFNRASEDCCSNCKAVLDGSASQYVELLEMPNAKTIRRDRITCDEEERMRRGYKITTHFRLAPGAGGQPRLTEAEVGCEASRPLLRIAYAPTATLFRVNHGWKRNPVGFRVNMEDGSINPSEQEEPATTMGQVAIVRLYVAETDNLALVYPPAEVQNDLPRLASLQYALQRGMEQFFQIEESELASERIGEGDRRAILYWEAAEGGAGVLRRLVEEPTAIANVAKAALERLHFDPDSLKDGRADCARACYECLLSYRNQPDHYLLDRHLVAELLRQLAASRATPHRQGRDYEAHYAWLRSLTDSRSELERRFLEHLYRTRRRLPDEAQKALAEVNTIPDFYYADTHACVFCDGAVHDEPAQRERDRQVRAQLRDYGYRVIVIRYDGDLEAQIAQYPDVFGEPAR